MIKMIKLGYKNKKIVKNNLREMIKEYKIKNDKMRLRRTYRILRKLRKF